MAHGIANGGDQHEGQAQGLGLSIRDAASEGQHAGSAFLPEEVAASEAAADGVTPMEQEPAASD